MVSMKKKERHLIATSIMIWTEGACFKTLYNFGCPKFGCEDEKVEG